MTSLSSLIAAAFLLLTSCSSACEWTEQPWSLPDAPVTDGTCWAARAFDGSGIDQAEECPSENINRNCLLTRAGYLPDSVKYYVREGEHPDPPQWLFDVPCSIKSCDELDRWVLGQ